MRGLEPAEDDPMSDCCEASVRAPRESPCPVTGTSGIRVGLQTVKAILRNSSLRRLRPVTHYFCPEPTCDVVYFSEQGELYSKNDVRTTVWQKEPAGDRLLCYCFGEDEQTIRSEIRATGTSHALDRVAEHVRSGRCACDIRNPRGVCCLGDLKAAIARLRAQRSDA
jgi:hypothetical protein